MGQGAGHRGEKTAGAYPLNWSSSSNRQPASKEHGTPARRRNGIYSSADERVGSVKRPNCLDMRNSGRTLDRIGQAVFGARPMRLMNQDAQSNGDTRSSVSCSFLVSSCRQFDSAEVSKKSTPAEIRWALEVRPRVLGRFLHYEHVLPAQATVKEAQLENNILSGPVPERLLSATLGVLILATRCTEVVWRHENYGETGLRSQRLKLVQQGSRSAAHLGEDDRLDAQRPEMLLHVVTESMVVPVDKEDAVSDLR